MNLPKMKKLAKAMLHMDVHFNPLSLNRTKRHLSVINYYEILNRLIKDPVFVGYDEVTSARMSAASWQVCAVGNICEAIPRSTDIRVPDDKVLFRLGMRFLEKWKVILDLHASHQYDAIPYYAKQAIEIQDQIEKRALELLKELFPTKLEWAKYVYQNHQYNSL